MRLRFVFFCQVKTLVQLYILGKDRFAGSAYEAVGWQMLFPLATRRHSATEPLQLGEEKR
jgi:hypothetical protein